MDRQLPDGDWSTISAVNSCNVSLKAGCSTLGQTFNPNLSSEGKKNDVFKINGDDDDDEKCV